MCPMKLSLIVTLECVNNKHISFRKPRRAVLKNVLRLVLVFNNIQYDKIHFRSFSF